MILITSCMCVLIWFFTLLHAQKHHNNKYRWQDTVISKYITHDKTLQIGFVILALGFFLASGYFRHDMAALIIFIIAGVGALFVMFTETFINHQRLHIASAGLAYGGGLIGCILVSLNTPLLLGIAISNIIYVAIGTIIEDEVGDRERYTALGLIAWFCAALFYL